MKHIKQDGARVLSLLTAGLRAPGDESAAQQRLDVPRKGAVIA